MKYTQTSSCANCPFRKDVEPFITPERVKQIINSLVRTAFPCHKTLEYFDAEEGTDSRETENTQHCAGALILCEREEAPSQMMRIMERLGGYDRHKLKMDAPVYDSFEEMIEAHEKAAV